MIKERFKTKFAETIFRNKYAQGPDDSWDALSERVVEDVCGTRWGTDRPLMSKEERDALTNFIKEMKFIPGGRYLYYAGRPAKYYNNCLIGSTRILTDRGWRRADELGWANVLSPVDGKYYPAEFKSHGKQLLNKITFASLRGDQSHTWEVFATRQHHWPLIDGNDTFDLRVGDVVPANTYSAGFDGLGFAHGFVFGDGNANGQLRLCADKDKKYLELLSKFGTVTYPPSAHGDPVLYFNQNINWKALPVNESPAYIASFILGWIAADRSETAGNQLCSVNREALEWFREHAAYAGLVITGKLRSQVRNVDLGKYSYQDHTIYIQNYQYGKDFSGFKVISIEPFEEQEVYCPYEPVHHRIIIDHNIDTYQCFLLRAEIDSREEWADLVKRAMACLMTGGGIGIDYSRLRGSGKALHRTGGVASGPIPLMYTINEIGRNVMQGGSRRSAIYASLHSNHEDIWQFLEVKNWDKKSTGLVKPNENEFYSYGDLKRADFNAPCPLDMTNISVNYDSLLPDGSFKWNDTVFLANCYQALSTGEPGFSFNFGDKKNETLRNACCEVTSEDDSDCCNLGSVNLGNIETIEEFKEVVRLAAKFLVCGTLRADLPYEKVYKVREKNRRLGLGLMGIHQWLLMRNYRYEVVPELHKWLEVYKNESKKAADEHADHLFVSRPVAYRAIAPTGSLAIRASTTTGIEPLFAVAFKRRYLTQGTKWKYQFVIDATADYLIQTYGLKPEKIETASDLAEDYERRIKFQADIQDYVDMSISSTINLPAWGSRKNSPENVENFARILAKYAPRLRGFTCYPDGSRGGQPLIPVSYEEAVKHKDVEYEEIDVCDLTGKGGTCGS